jgi:excisionase family DNA binding protein
VSRPPLGDGPCSKPLITEPAEDQLLRGIEMARLLNLGSKTIVRWTAKALPCIRTIGGQRRYYWGDVAAWLDREV